MNIKFSQLPLFALFTGLLIFSLSVPGSTDSNCKAERSTPLLPADLKLCSSLSADIRKPNAFPLDQYEKKLGDFLANFCHRDSASGWVRDKRVRDTGPFTMSLIDGEWKGKYHGTHAPVVIWYSPEMFAWLKKNRPQNESQAPAQVEAVPDGAVLIKEMFPVPAAACNDIDPVYLLPTSGAAVMVRDNKTSKDGWFYGWFGWQGWDPDWPAKNGNRLPYMGYGQYCVNCHASAKDNMIFASLRNIDGQPGEPIVFLSQFSYESTSEKPHHHAVRTLPKQVSNQIEPYRTYNPAITQSMPVSRLPRPDGTTVSRMASQTYDNVWVSGNGPTIANQYVTSDQCLGCHDAGGTGLQFDMTEPNPHGDNLINLSPYATWRSSPMGLAGRDPIFFAQLASETETFHPNDAALIENSCLGCHGILGQRQYEIDTAGASGKCEDFRRSMVDAIPWPADNSGADHARYGALARDGISCTACHHMVLGEADSKDVANEPQNQCIEERQSFFNPNEQGFARTFTGSFLVGPPTTVYGPFESPKTKPMQHALGIEPVHNSSFTQSEVCGSCHTVHLPVLHKGKIITRIYEQTTYPEWAFSDYRTGVTADGPLPGGKGNRAQSCQSCHMPSRDENGRPYRSKIAGIQEYSNFPQIDNVLPAEAIDLPERDGFARHTLVGLNVFLIKMAQQFPTVLGIRTQDPMLVSKGMSPLERTEQAMLDQAESKTADIRISSPVIKDSELTATVTVSNKVGHKFPSGTGFRRAFVHFEVLDQDESVIWASGRTNGAGVIVDENGTPVAGELWWNDDCSARMTPGMRLHQPHFQSISRQDQSQIYQELASTPPDTDTPNCGHDATPAGQLTTSFLSICAEVKDNRLLPHGFMSRDQRRKIAAALGAGHDLADDVSPTGVGDDPDYLVGGGDSYTYNIDVAQLTAKPVLVRATLYYQSVPPFYLQDRFCTSQSDDTQRLYYLVGHLNLEGSAAENWKLKIASSGNIAIEIR